MLAFALLALAAVASAQTKPAPSEDFFAQVNTELHMHDRTIMGQGAWAIDTTSNEAVENYQFQDPGHGGHFFLLNLQRYDLGKVYQIQSYDHNHCNVTNVSGNLPSTWAWLSAAQYGGSFDFHGQTLQTWNATFAGVTLVLAVNPNNVNVPVLFNRFSENQGLFIEFYHFNATTNFPHNVFDVPPQCGGDEATPTRPNPSEDFDATVNVEVTRNNQPVQGYGRVGSDQTNNKYISDYQVFDPRHSGPIRVFHLLRYDLGEGYMIDSVNQTDCYKQNLTGNMPAFWSWVAAATFAGNHFDPHLGQLDIWNYNSGGVNLTLVVPDRSVNTPVFFAREFSGNSEHWEFQSFYPNAPPSNVFTVPQECQ